MVKPDIKACNIELFEMQIWRERWMPHDAFPFSH